jgi:hypothetical protein
LYDRKYSPDQPRAPRENSDDWCAASDNLAELKWNLAALRFQLALIRFEQLRRKTNFNPSQPRVPMGNPDGGQWMSGNGADQSLRTRLTAVIKVCIAGSRSLSTDRWGNKSFSVTYECAEGRSFTVSGKGHKFPGILPDPFQ